MHRFFGWMTVAFLCCAADGEGGEEKPDARLMEARADFDAATKLKEAGKYPEALTRAEHSLDLSESVLKATQLDITRYLNLVGDLYRQNGDLAQAESPYQRALALREATLGANHPDVIDSLNSLAGLYSDQELYSQAEPLYKRVLALREASVGPTHPDVVLALNNLAALYFEQKAYSQAEPLYKRVLALRETSLNSGHPDVVVSLNNLAALYFDQKLYGQAEPLYKRALALRETTLKSGHPDVIESLNNLAALYFDQGLYDQAAPLYQRALVLREAALGENHSDVADSIDNLAVIYLNQGSYGQAEPLYQRALALRQASLGESHPGVVESLNNLGTLYYNQGLYGQAEPLYKRALALRQASLGENHPGVAPSLDHLARLYLTQGLYDRAEPLYKSALVLREAALGENHPEFADSLNRLAHLYFNQGLYGQAEPLYQRVLVLREAALGKNHPGVVDSLDHLAHLYFNQGLYGQAEPLYQRTLALRKDSLGEKHPDVAVSLNHLAHLYFKQGLYDQAEPLYQGALTLREAALGPGHPDIADSLNSLANLRLAQHRVTDALPLLTRAFSISEQRLRWEALDFSEARLSSFLLDLRANEELLYSLLRASPQDPRVRRLALSAVLLLKGRSVEETARISQTIYGSQSSSYSSLGAQARDTFERLRHVRAQLATCWTVGPGSLSPTDYQRRLKTLTDERDSLEADLAKSSASLRVLSNLPGPQEIVDRVTTALPKDGALVEFVAYKDKSPVSKSGTPSTAAPDGLRYLAMVLFPDGSTRAVDLGLAEPIDSAASLLRDALADRDDNYLEKAKALYTLVFKPLRPLLGTTRRLLLSPDSTLGLVSFATLHDGRGFLLDAFDLSYLTSGRDLLPRPQEPTRSSVVVLADPKFSSAPASPPGSAPPVKTPAESLAQASSSATREPSRGSWLMLPGTKQEAQGIQVSLPQAQLFLGSEASKERLLQLPTPGILHVATHGFFLEDFPDAAFPASRAPVQFNSPGGARPLLRPRDPLLRSGLVLAGARPPVADAAGPPPDDALVTALELAGLNLWGTQLVVLSACDTGRGQVRLGQGIYGLRRALVIAGAETVVMSLWKVNDDSTRHLMDAYYRNLLAGQGRSVALRSAMRSLQKTYPHPHDWAPFIALGSDAPLRGIASSAMEGEASGTAP